MLLPLGWAPAWVIAVLICREMTITGLQKHCLTARIFLAASPMGKLKTAYQSTALGMLLWHYPLDIPQVGLYIDVHSSGIVCCTSQSFWHLSVAQSTFTSTTNRLFKVKNDDGAMMENSHPDM